LSIFHYIFEACNSFGTSVHYIENTSIASINRRYATEHTRIETVFDSLRTERHGTTYLTKFTAVTDRRTDTPAAVTTLKVSQSTGLNGCPLINAFSHATSTLGAAQASKNLVNHGHISHFE